MSEEKTGKQPAEKVWIKFDVDPALSAGKKTKVWGINRIDNAYSLGYIRWAGNFCAYAFFPNHATLFDVKCLKLITDFME